MAKIFFTLIYSLLIINGLQAQDDLTKILDETDSLDKNRVDYENTIFKATRVVNGQSVKLLAKGSFQYVIQHRFGKLNSGFQEAFGLDQATIRMGFDYGISDKLNVGIGRSKYEKTAEAYLKWGILRQSTGAKNMPFTLVYYTSLAINGLAYPQSELQNNFQGRLTYTHQIMLARKFSERISLQISPTYIHRNLTPSKKDDHDIYSVGFAGRYKLTKRLALCGEYFYVLSDQTAKDYYNAFSLGFDIETGGHVFQLHLTNAQAMIEKGFIAQTDGSWDKGDIYFGFNISRNFNLSRKK